MLANFQCSNNVCQLNPLPVRYIWNANSLAEFQSALQTEEIRNKITNYMNISITDTQDVACQLNSIITEAASISLKSSRNSKNRLCKTNAKQKHKTRKKWFDSDLRIMRKRVIITGKLYSMLPNDPVVRGRYFKLYIIYSKAKKRKERHIKNSC